MPRTRPTPGSQRLPHWGGEQIGILGSKKHASPWYCNNDDIFALSGYADISGRQLGESEQSPGDPCSAPRPLHAKHPEALGYVHREVAPLHFVMGRLSPFYIERAFRRDGARAVWAVYFGRYTSTGDVQMGMGSGGAIASVLDLLTANLAALYVRGMAPTASLSVRTCPCGMSAHAFASL